MIEVSRVQYGRIMEESALKTLESFYDSIVHIGGNNPIDILASKQNIRIGINVKSGKTGYHINRPGLKRLISQMPDIIPSYLFLDDAGSYLFQLVKIFPPVRALEEIKIPNSGRGIPGVEKSICPECGSDDVVRAGTALTRKGRRQRWQCNGCGRKFRTPEEAEG